MIEQKEYDHLRDEIQRLRDEQQRLRDEQEKLRREAPSNGHKSQQDAQDSGKPKEGPSDGKQQGKEEGKPEQKSAEKPGQASDKPSDREEDEQQPKPPLAQRVRTYVQAHRKQILIGTIIFVVAAVLAIILLIYLSSYESTDDAQVDGHINAISARIAGTITGVYIDNNQAVNANQLCVELDPNDYQTALDQAKASYAQAEAQLRAENPNVPITQTTNLTAISSSGADVVAAEAAVNAAQQDYQAKLAAVRQAEANNYKAQTDVTRYKGLVDRQEISREQFDTIVAAAKTQAAAVEATQASALAAQRAIDQSKAQLLQAQSKANQANQNAPRSLMATRAQLVGRQAALLAAKAQTEQAALNISYTKILAPVSGIISDRTAEVGQRINPGEQLFAISQLDDIWITANFKETQLKKMRPHQAVDIYVDAYSRKFHGYVENMPGATGSVMSLLPPENATGNFVKVVQRLPVRIRLNRGEDPDHLLRIGMSVEPKVWLR